ncbi:acid phosphatase [Sporothrix schenckii 1099-18]|uniref:3-phytase n=2 Tax=Sporothrix schenckii TaxID=29908 RepID=U7Q571_SPOS1|nr:acid phosphatase [Sporothrix schenckii 1099-18]ERT02963.1 hypothetical protein HMPREF1624_01267 [Sporothrix schenckii ATCC 58251]KJR84669.1 acid phosphatase [Sporothrix schenckii 1099-18]
MAGHAKDAGYEPVAGVDAIDGMELEQRDKGARRSGDGKDPLGYRSVSHEDDAAVDDGADDETRGFLASASGGAGTGPSGATFVPANLHHRSGDDAPPKWLSRRTVRVVAISFVTCLAVCIGFKFVADNTGLVLSLAHAQEADGDGSKDSSGSKDCRPTTVTVPQYFQTTPQLFAGPTATGRPAFLAQTVTIDPTATYVANQPLQTNILVDGVPSDGSGRSIFHHMGYLSPYQPAPGFGVQEYALPPGAEIVQLQMLSRHGSRYPTSGVNVKALGDKLAKFRGKFKATGALAFLEDWAYSLGHEILVPKGRQELFDSGVLHSYMYGSLYNPNSKIIVRTTTQDRMLKSAENFMAGFFGLEWTNNATIEVIIEQDGFNNSLAGYLNCPNSQKDTGGNEANAIWVENYLRNATARFQALLSGTNGFDWTIQDTYAAQTMCPYETVAYGFSRFCDLFTYDEWVGFGYSTDLVFAGGSGFQSATGRAVGLGYQQELVARLRNHTLGYAGSQINTTLDNNTDTFPLNQSLYLDFSHDSNIVSVLTALGFTQFAQFLPPSSYPGPHNFTLAHVVPFGARLDVEVIRAPKPVKADRSGYDDAGPETKYIHFVLNQRTLPLGASFPECDVSRVDGWCELETFLRVQDAMAGRAKFDEACFGPFTAQPYGTITDGAPI